MNPKQSKMVLYLAQRCTGSLTRLSSVAMYSDAVVASSFRFLIRRKRKMNQNKPKATF